MPIIGLVPAAIHVFDSITSKITEEITILIDIEATQTTLLLGRNLAELKSHKLPFGYSLYITKNLNLSIIFNNVIQYQVFLLRPFQHLRK